MKSVLALGFLLAASSGEVPIVRPEVLEPLFLKLRGLTEGADLRVNIVHIGDSHIQAGILTGEVRRLLQARFGDAGRGLVFPWTAAGTNSPGDVVSASNAVWKARRVTTPEGDVPAGVSGWGMLGPEGPFVIKVELRSPGESADFDRVRLFAEQGPGWAELVAASHPDRMILEKSSPGFAEFLHTVQAGDTLYGVAKSWEVTVSEIMRSNGLSDDKIYPGQSLRIRRKNPRPARVDREGFTTLAPFRPAHHGGNWVEANLPGPTNNIFILPASGSAGDDRVLLYGMSLEKAAARGVLYHALGVNGAEFRHFQKSPSFFVQMGDLNPDLVVVSLGTNESVKPGFDPGVFKGQVLEFLDTLQSSLPNAPILLTTPPDSTPSAGGTSRAGDAARIILECASERQLASWDLYAAMGGPGSMDLWMGRNLARDDGVHLNDLGYMKLGGAFAGALLEAYAAP